MTSSGWNRNVTWRHWDGTQGTACWLLAACGIWCAGFGTRSEMEMDTLRGVFWGFFSQNGDRGMWFGEANGGGGGLRMSRGRRGEGGGGSGMGAWSRVGTQGEGGETFLLSQFLKITTRRHRPLSILWARFTSKTIFRETKNHRHNSIKVQNTAFVPSLQK